MGHRREKCSKDDIHAFKKVYRVFKKLTTNDAFLCAAKLSTNPEGFTKGINALLDAASAYRGYRITQASVDGRVFFDSAFPIESHDGVNVLDGDCRVLNIGDGIEVQYANWYSFFFNRHFEDSHIYDKFLSRLSRHGYGIDCRWDAAVKDFQYFVTKTFGSQCDCDTVVIRVSEFSRC